MAWLRRESRKVEIGAAGSRYDVSLTGGTVASQFPNHRFWSPRAIRAERSVSINLGLGGPEAAWAKLLTRFPRS